jgi:hypothetical protein
MVKLGVDQAAWDQSNPENHLLSNHHHLYCTDSERIEEKSV